MDIRFRIFNPKYNEFKYWGFEGNGFTGIPTGSGLTIEFCKNHSELYVGVDRNGKECFVSDICKDKKGNYFFIFWNGTSVVYVYNGHTTQSPTHPFNVVGNVYENFDLLKPFPLIRDRAFLIKYSLFEYFRTGNYDSIYFNEDEFKEKVNDGKEDRYFVDVRTGCAAIRDREHPLYDKDNQGLNDEMPDVVKFVMGSASGTTGNCNTSWVWQISSSRVDELEEECKTLNDENNKV